MTRYFIDTEFLDTGSTIDLVSIGIVCEDGRELYLQSVEFEPKNANEWVKENVLPRLTLHPLSNPFPSRSPFYDQFILDWAYHKTIGGQCRTGGIDPLCRWRSRKQIHNEVLAFVKAGEGNPEFIGWCAGYDWVALCQLFGTMLDIPSGWPHYIRDFQHILDDRGILDDDLPQQDNSTHNALEDAKHLAKLWGYIVRNDAWQ